MTLKEWILGGVLSLFVVISGFLAVHLISADDAHFDKLDNGISSLNGKIDGITSTLGDSKTTVAVLNSQGRRAQEQIAQTLATVQQNQTALAKLANDVAYLQGQLSGVQGQLAGMQEELKMVLPLSGTSGGGMVPGTSGNSAEPAHEEQPPPK